MHFTTLSDHIVFVQGVTQHKHVLLPWGAQDTSGRAQTGVLFVDLCIYSSPHTSPGACFSLHPLSGFIPSIPSLLFVRTEVPLQEICVFYLLDSQVAIGCIHNPVWSPRHSSWIKWSSGIWNLHLTKKTG